MLDRVIPLQSKHSDHWDIIRIEIWTDSGRIIFYPATHAFKDRIDIAGVQITCNEMSELFMSVGEKKLDEWVQGVQGKILKSIKHVMNNKSTYPYKVYDNDGVELKT